MRELPGHRARPCAITIDASGSAPSVRDTNVGRTSHPSFAKIAAELEAPHELVRISCALRRRPRPSRAKRDAPWFASGSFFGSWPRLANCVSRSRNGDTSPFAPPARAGAGCADRPPRAPAPLRAVGERDPFPRVLHTPAVAQLVSQEGFVELSTDLANVRLIALHRARKARGIREQRWCECAEGPTFSRSAARKTDSASRSS